MIKYLVSKDLPIPKVIIVNGIEIPLGHQGKLTKNQTYYLPNFQAKSYYDPAGWEGSEFDNLMLKLLLN